MQLDALNCFVLPGATPQSVVAADGVEVQIGSLIDLLGSGVGTAPQGIIGNTTLWGHDPGIGRVKPVIQVTVGTAFTTGNAAAGTFALEYAADLGAAGNYQPDTWYVASETQAHAVSVLSASQVINMDVAPAPPEVPRPRFVRLTVKPGTGAHFTAGTITFAGLTMAADQNAVKNAANNYVVA